jgi:hypothetical protein
MANPLAESSSRRCQFSRLHDGHILISVTAFTLLWIIAGDRVGAAKIVTAAAGAEMLVEVIKRILQHPRPTIVPYLVEFSGFSYPSGHALVGHRNIRNSVSDRMRLCAATSGPNRDPLNSLDTCRIGGDFSSLSRCALPKRRPWRSADWNCLPLYRRLLVAMSVRLILRNFHASCACCPASNAHRPGKTRQTGLHSPPLIGYFFRQA